MPFGARLSAEGVRFRLWAPAAREMTLALEEGDSERCQRMEAAGEGWFELFVEGARAGTRYRYVLADGTRVPDPASRFQPEDVKGPSEVIDPRTHAWREADWLGRAWNEALVYELHVGCFAGDFDGLRTRLDHLERLGVTAIELMPLADFAGRRGWGYDGVLPFAPDSTYGRPEALKRLVEACHARGFMILLDVVYNHFGPSGNYLGQYAPQFFTDRAHTPWGEAIDFSRRVVRDFYIHNALYWLEEYHFDGLRFDAVDQIRDTESRHILTEIAQTVRTQIPDREIHLLLENDDNAARYLEREQDRPRLYTAQWNDDFHHAAHVVATDERDGYYMDYAEAPVAMFARALAEGFIYQGEYSRFRQRTRGEKSTQLPPLAFVDFLQNHDQIGNRAFGKRLTELAPAARLRALYALLLLSPAVPMLFMGEEWAASTPFLFFCDFPGELGEAVREGRRREFAHFAALNDPAQRKAIPDPTAKDTFERSRLDWDESGAPPHAEWLAFMTDLIALRRRELVPRLSGMQSGAVRMLDDSGFVISWPLARGGDWHMAANLGTRALEMPSLAGRAIYPEAVPSGELTPNAVLVFCDEH